MNSNAFCSSNNLNRNLPNMVRLDQKFLEDLTLANKVHVNLFHTRHRVKSNFEGQTWVLLLKSKRF